MMCFGGAKVWVGVLERDWQRASASGQFRKCNWVSEILQCAVPKARDVSSGMMEVKGLLGGANG